VLQVEKQEFSMSNFYEPSISPELSDPSIGRLLSLFPNAAPVHIPVRVGLPIRAKGASERTAIMFGFNDTAIFLVNFPLCGGEAVRVKPAVGPGEASAVVVALMPKGRGLAVAVRFNEGIPKWFARAEPHLVIKQREPSRVALA
jgi:hypothetical protein